MTILVDIDNTITNFSEALLQVNNNEYSTNYTYDQITSYNWFDKTFEDPWFITTRHYFWNTVKINPEAIHTLESWVKQSHKVLLVTASYFSDALGRKIEKTLEAFNPELINERNIVIAQDKSIINGDLMIDDCVDNLYNFNGVCVCYKQPWNQDYTGAFRSNKWNLINDIVQVYKQYWWRKS